MRIIDIHTHGLGDYDTRTTNFEDILKIARLHGAQGVTDIVPTIYSGSIAVMRQQMTAVKEAMALQASERSTEVNSKRGSQDLKSAGIIGVHLEGPFLNPLRSGALDNTFFQKPSEKTWKALIEGFQGIVKIVTIAPELDGAISLIRTMSDMGIVVSLGHSDASYGEAEKAARAGAAGITHFLNAMRGFHHREPGLAGFGLVNSDICVEIIADPFHLHRGTIELVFKAKNPKKIIIVSDSVKGVHKTLQNRALTDYEGRLRGGAMTIAESAKRLVAMGFHEDRVRQCITANPLSYLMSRQ